MKQARINANIKNLQMAKKLLETAFEDLKNEAGFRIVYRPEVRLAMTSQIEDVIDQAKKLKGEE